MYCSDSEQSVAAVNVAVGIVVRKRPYSVLVASGYRSAVYERDRDGNVLLEELVMRIPYVTEND